MDVGLKVAVTPLGTPLADKATAESKPPETVLVIVELPDLPLDTEIEAGDALRVKLGLAGAVTVKVTVVVFVIASPIPLTVIVYVPVATVEATAMVMVEVPEPGAAMEVGLKLTVTPAGWPVADKAIAELKPPDTAVVMVDVPLFPCTTETEVGEAEMVKLGDEDVRNESIDQVGTIRTAPAAGQIVAGCCRKAVIAAGDVVEIGVIAGRHTNR